MKVELEPSDTLTGERALARASSFSILARDVATLGSGTLLAGIFGTLLIFVIPRLVSVEDYGYWRLFALYAGYAGFLHFGLADGAFLCWAGRPLEVLRQEVLSSLSFLVWQQLAVMVPAGVIVAYLMPSRLRFIGIAVLFFASVMNATTLLQYGLQGARLFKPVAVATAVPAGIFVLMAVLWDLHRTPSFRELVLFYIFAWTGALVYLWMRVAPRRGTIAGSTWSLGKKYLLLGWPIMLANGGFGLVQSADRVVVSSTLSVSNFAQYSLAASTMFVPITVIAAIYRVFFSHVTTVEQAGRSRVYSYASKLLLIAWSLLLPYYFILRAFVRHFLPKYNPSLRIAGILLLGVIFLAGIQVLHMSYSYLEGRQGEFLRWTIGALVVSFSFALVLAFLLHSLAAVAIGQVAALALWWFFNEWKLRQVSGQRWRDWVRVLCVFLWSVVSYIAAMSFSSNFGFQIPIYYGLVVFVLVLTCPAEFRLGWKLLKSRGMSLQREIGA